MTYRFRSTAAGIPGRSSNRAVRRTPGGDSGERLELTGHMTLVAESGLRGDAAEVVRARRNQVERMRKAQSPCRCLGPHSEVGTESIAQMALAPTNGPRQR